MTKQIPRVKFYDYSDNRTILLTREDVKRVYDQFVGIDYTDVGDFMECHKISKKHKTYIEGGKVCQS